MSLSIAMICKNEEQDILKCLESVAPVADEYVITDTGSTDNTIDIIKEFDKSVDIPVYLKHIEWEGNYFSGCRNYGLQFCSEPWIFWIDCDETLISDSYDEVKEVVSRGDIYSAFAGLLSELPDGRISKHYLPKFFRRGTAHFEGIVHNQLVHANPTLATGIEIYHTGYNLTQNRMAAKRKRTAKLLQRQIDKQANDAFARMNLSRTLMNDGEHEQALKIAEEGLEHNSSDSCEQMLFYSVAVCGTKLKQYEKAEEACWKALRINAQNLDITFALANVQFSQKRWSRAILFLNRYLQLKNDETVQPIQRQVNFLITDFFEAEDKAYNLLGICYNKIGKKDKALDMHRKAAQCKNNPSLLKNLASLYEQCGKTLEAYRIWRHMVEEGYVNDFVIKKLREVA